MSILTYPLGFIGGGKDDFYNGVMENSLRFEDGDSAYLNRIREDQAQVNKFYKHLVENCQYEKIETLTGHIKYRKKR